MSIFPLTRRGLMVGGVALAAMPSASRAAGFGDDAALLERAYTALHPGLYRYNTPTMIAAHFAALRTTLAATTDLRVAFFALARATAAVRCGHSYPNFYNQSQTVTAALFDRRDRLPFHFHWLGDRMIVRRDLSPGAPLPPGSDIIAIDGQPARDTLAALLPLTRADGHNDGKRRAALGVDGRERFDAFDLYLPAALPDIGARGTVRITAVDPRGRGVDAVVALLTPGERAAGAQSPAASAKDAVLWRVERRPRGIAILTMPTWSVYNGTWDWAAWLDTALDGVVGDGTRAVIVDLRGNEGGLNCGDAILARMIDRDLVAAPDRQRVRYRSVPPNLSPYVDTWDNSFLDWGAAAVGPDADGGYDLVRKDAARPPIRARARRFTGRLIVLIDASNSSATFNFAKAVRDHGLGTLVGETTGGNRRGINGGGFLFLRLPASGLEVDIPLIGTFPATPQPDAGLVPDVTVTPTVADIAAGHDAALVAALSLAVAT